MEMMDFSDLRPKEVQVRGLLGHDYVLREAKGDAVLRYQEAELGCFENVHDDAAGKRVSRRIKPAYKIESLLVSLCLFDEAGKAVPQSVVETFPPSAQRKLYVAAMQMTFPEDDLPTLRRQRDALSKEIERLEGILKNGQAATPASAGA